MNLHSSEGAAYDDEMRAILVLLLAAALLPAAEWNGYERRDFQVDGVAGYVVLPRAVAPGKPWLWRARFPGFHPEAAIGLLAKGYHVAYFDLPNIFGSPRAVAAWDRFYAHVRREFGLAEKVALEGVSRGGLFVYNWAAKNPDKVDCIYCESPVCDMKSWPGGKGKGRGSEADWREALASYGFTEQQMMAFGGNPVDTLAPLAARRIPLLHVVSELDEVVPPAENTAILAGRYRDLGGPITVYTNTAGPQTLHGHHFPLDDPGMEVNFVLRHTPGMERLAGTGLTPHGTPYFKLRDGLRNSLARFAAGEEARVVFLGGSITAGAGWRDSISEWLRQRFPRTNFHFVNAGIPSTGSTPGAFRLRRDVFAHGRVDLLIQEAAVNDSTNGFTAKEQLRGVEGIVRQARLLQPEIDVVLLHFADPEKVADYRRGRTPEVIATHEQVAGHYAVPSIDLAREVAERIEAGEFDWGRDFVNLHPSPFGHSVYQRSLVRLFEAAWREPGPPAVAPRAHALPAPIDSQSYFDARLGAPEAPVSGDGWRLVPSWRPEGKAATRPGFVDVPVLVAGTPGATMKMAFRGRGIGLFAISGADAGRLSFRIDGGEWREVNLLTKWSRSLHLPWAVMLDGDLAEGPHELELRLESGAARIAHWLVNGRN